MADKIKLVQGDTRPTLVVTLTDEVTELPINITGATPRLKFRKASAATLTATLDGTVTDGVNGQVAFFWTQDALAGEAGDYEGEIEITFGDGTVQTVYEILKFKVRQDF